MAEEITVVHGDIPVTYDEKENVWRFTLRGRDRSAESLAKAKEAIDKPVPSEKKSGFEKIAAIKVSSYYMEAEFGFVTSIAEKSRYSREEQVWFSDGKSRSKVDLSDLVPDTQENRKTVEEAQALKRQSELFSKKARKMIAALPRLKITIPE